MQLNTATNLDVSSYMQELGRNASRASSAIAHASTEQKNTALQYIADAVDERSDHIISENARDLEAGRKSGLTSALMDRLELNPERVERETPG